MVYYVSPQHIISMMSFLDVLHMICIAIRDAWLGCNKWLFNNIYITTAFVKLIQDAYVIHPLGNSIYLKFSDAEANINISHN